VLTKPTDARDEEFHTAITEDLGEWAWTTSPVVEAVRIVGGEQDRSPEIRDVLERLGVPCGVHGTSSPVGAAIVERAGPEARLPLVEVMESTILSDPSNRELAVAFGVSVDVSSTRFDLAVVGAGPAGLGAAVYGASEGLSTLVVEAEAFGGQAGTSSMIRNYLGFPRGTRGRDLATKAFAQVWSFGADIVVTWPVTALSAAESGYRLDLADGSEVHSRSVVIATGVSYRRLDATGLSPLTGAGVYYGAAGTEAQAMAGRHVFIAGGANSAGQAAVNLARHARQVTLVVRRGSVADTMSQYLIDEINGTANIDIRRNTEVAGAAGDGQLEVLMLRDNRTGTTESVSAAALFVLIGAEPHTDWLPASVQRDSRGFLLTGSDFRRGDGPDGWSLQRPPLPLETSAPGVFEAGDVRRHSVKRVAAAVGEGSIAATQVNQFLQEPDASVRLATS
jgi:thioredoxin reductase (NADPH)